MQSSQRSKSNSALKAANGQDKLWAYDDCDNFRGIALLSVPGKVFCRVIQCKLREKANQMLRENQCVGSGRAGVARTNCSLCECKWNGHVSFTHHSFYASLT